MRTRHLLLAFSVCALAACSDPTAPRLPQPEDEKEDKEVENPGVRSVAAVNQTAPVLILG